MKKLSKCSLENLRLLGEVLYNFTGLEYHLNLTQNYYQSKAMLGSFKGDFFEFYYQNYRLMKYFIEDGKTFEFPLYNLDGTKKPYIYNQL
jgi:hypothetical protein